MSLIAWYPLNGNTNNQGVGDSTYNLTITNTLSTPTLTNDGKVTSKCFATNITSSDNGKASNYHTSVFTPPNSNITISCWFKPTKSDGGTQHILQIGGGDYRGNSGTNDTPVGLGIRLSNLILTLNCNGLAYSVNKTLTINTWYHCAITLDNNTYTMYLNGESIYTRTKTNPFNSGSFVIGSLYVTSYYTFYGCINDVRYYNNCLSTKEVKELSKGLCLHYKLSRGGENLIKGIPTYNSPNSGGTTISWDDSLKNNFTSYASKKLTLSYDYEINNIKTQGTFGTRIGCEFNYYSSSTNQTNKTLNYIGLWWIPGIGYSGLGHKSVTITMPNTIYTLNYLGSFYIQCTSDNIKITNIKLEEGDHDTSWIPNKSDTLYSQLGYDNNEPDCSGYSNDGTKVDTHTYSNNSPRYEGSTFIPSGGIFGSRKFSDNVESITLSAWVKSSNIASQSILGNWECGGCGIYTNSSKKSVFDYYDGSAYKTAIGTTTLSNDTWYLITGVFIYTDKKAYIYVNGVLETQVTVSTYIRIGSATNVPMSIGNPTSTSVSGITNCYVSDARVYTTALSSDDVKALYDTPISIDNDKNLHCMELVQTNNQTSFCKSGIVKMELLPIPTITERCAGNGYAKNLKIWANGSQLKLNDVHKIRIIFRSRGDGSPTSSKCSSIGCIMWENSWKWSNSLIYWSSATAYNNIGKIIDYTGSLTINSTITSTTTSIPISLYWIIQNGCANGNDGQTHDLYYYKYWNATTGEVYAESGTSEYDRITTNDFIEN